MSLEQFQYAEYVTGQTLITHTCITIAQGEVIEKFTPLVHDSASGHFKAAAADTSKAHFLSSFAVDASAAPVEHSAIKSIDIDPDVVSYPDAMTEQTKSGLFAGTPISVQKPN